MNRLVGRLRRAGYHMRSAWVLLQCGLAALALALFALWLALPEGSAWGTASAIALAVLGFAGAAWAESRVFVLARRCGIRVAAWKGALLLAGICLLYWLVTAFFDAGSLQDRSRARDWADHSWVWHVASYRSLVRLQAAGWWLLRWLLAAALLPFAVEGAAAGANAAALRRAARPLRKPLYPAVLLGCAAAATLVTSGLLRFRPELPELAEMLLAIAKVVTIFAVDLGGFCFVLSLLGTYLRDAERLMPGRPAAHPSSVQRRRRSSRAAR